MIPLFHYALRPGGYLFLGPSESVAGRPSCSAPSTRSTGSTSATRRWSRPPLSFPLTDRVRLLTPRRPWSPRAAGPRRAGRWPAPSSGSCWTNYAPACVVVNERGDVVYFSPRTGQYLEPPRGHAHA